MTTYNMFDVTYQVARELNIVTEGTATGGSTTTLVDTGYRTEDDDYWNGGSLWVLYDSAGASAAPEGEWGRITGHVSSTKTLTIGTALTVAIASGDRYGIADDEFPLDLMLSQINRTFADFGDIVYTDTTTITIADDQTEYTLPTGMAHGSLKEVWLQNDDSDSDDNIWTPIRNWYVQITATGTAEELILPYQYASGYALKLVYVAPHPQTYTRTGKLSEQVPIKNVIYPAVLNLLRYRKRNTENPKYDTQIVKYETLVANLAPLTLPKKKGKLLTLGATGSLDSEPSKVYL